MVTAVVIMGSIPGSGTSACHGRGQKKKKDSDRFVGTFWPLEVQNVVSVLAVAIPVTRAFSKYC